MDGKRLKIDIYSTYCIFTIPNMGLDWILFDSSALDTFRGKGIARLSTLPTEIKDACYGDENGNLPKEDRDTILNFLQKLIESTTPNDFLYDEDTAITENDMIETKDFIQCAIDFLKSCNYEETHIVCWY